MRSARETRRRGRSRGHQPARPAPGIDNGLCSFVPGIVLDLAARPIPQSSKSPLRPARPARVATALAALALAAAMSTLVAAGAGTSASVAWSGTAVSVLLVALAVAWGSAAPIPWSLALLALVFLLDGHDSP